MEDYSDEAQEAFDRLLVLNKREKELSLENQAYLKEVSKLLLYLLLQQQRYADAHALTEKMVKWFMGNHID